jgi:hypothetical protein
MKFFCFRFDVILLVKSFNRLSVDEKQKTLNNLLKTLKTDGQVFVYESEWSKDNGLNIDKKHIFIFFCYLRKSFK